MLGGVRGLGLQRLYGESTSRRSTRCHHALLSSLCTMRCTANVDPFQLKNDGRMSSQLMVCAGLRSLCCLRVMLLGVGFRAPRRPGGGEEGGSSGATAWCSRQECHCNVSDGTVCVLVVVLDSNSWRHLHMIVHEGQLGVMGKRNELGVGGPQSFIWTCLYVCTVDRSCSPQCTYCSFPHE